MMRTNYAILRTSSAILRAALILRKSQRDHS